MQLPKAQRRLIFYSEGKNYWAHLEGLVQEILATSEIPICYISSEKDDPGLLIEHPHYRTFNIDEGFVRNWLFENINADVMVMTMPDLHQYQVKRSKHNVHYVYVQHSLMSLHMIYRMGAFDHYDTIFCSGPHHLEEIKAMEAQYNLPAKKLVEHGYGRLDSLIEESNKRSDKHKFENAKRHVLIAPTWGPEGIIESGVGEKVVRQLLSGEFKVTLRPHPQTIKHSKNKLDDILTKYSSNKLFDYETNVATQDSLFNSDVMISDWSGVALEYAYGLGKPVVFIDTPKKINNLAYKEINIEPFEISVREKIGKIISVGDISYISEVIKSVKKQKLESAIFNVGMSAKFGGIILKELCGEN